MPRVAKPQQDKPMRRRKTREEIQAAKQEPKQKYGFLHGGDVPCPEHCQHKKYKNKEESFCRTASVICAFTCMDAECATFQKLMDGRKDRIKTQRTGELQEDV